MRVFGFTVLALFAACCFAQAQTAEDIIKKYVSTIGGEKKWADVKTIIMKGEYDYGGQVFPFTSYASAPDHYKFVVPFNGKYYAQAYDGKSGWKIDAFKGESKPTLLSGKAARAMANEADVESENPLVKYHTKGHRAVIEGKDTVQGKPCFKIKVIRYDGSTEYYYFDAASNDLIQKYAVSKNEEMQGAWLTTIYSDYRTVDGLRFPFKSVSTSDGQMILTITIQQILINQPVNEKEFKP